jgi:tRNA-dihydrouridine synthase
MNFWQKIDKPIIGLSPMDGITDASFRFITAKHGGPDVTFTEFVNVDAAFFAPHVLIRDLTYTEIDRSTGGRLRYSTRSRTSSASSGSMAWILIWAALQKRLQLMAVGLL